MTDSSQDKRLSYNNRHWNLLPLLFTCMLAAGLLIFLGAIAYMARDLLIIFFLSILFAVFLSKLAGVAANYIPIPYKPAVGLVVTLLLGLALGFAFYFGTKVRAELTKAAGHVDEARAELSRKIDQYPALEAILNEAPVVRRWVKAVKGKSDSTSAEASAGEGERESEVAGKEQLPPSDSSSDSTKESPPAANNTDQATSAGNKSKLSQSLDAITSVAGSLLSAVGGMIQTTFGLSLNVLIIFFMGLFMALSPTKARDGVVRLVVPAGRDEARRVMNCIADSLWSWLIGRFATMTVTGASVGVGLWFLGVPMPITLGVVTGLLTFVPNIGGLLSLSLAMFVALPNGLATVGWVVGLYIAFQLVESYIITPLIQKHQVDIPPALLIGTQALFGFLLGFLGAMVASPCLVVLLVLHDEVYQKRIQCWQKS